MLEAASPGAWGSRLRVRIDHQTRDPSDTNAFNLEIREVNPNLPATSPPIQSEVFRNVSIDTASPLFVDKVLENRSKLARVRTPSPNRPDPVVDAAFTGGSDGVAITDNDIAAPTLEGAKEGLWSLQKADLFNLLCIPPLTRDADIGGLTRDRRGAILRETPRALRRRSAQYLGRAVRPYRPGGRRRNRLRARPQLIRRTLLSANSFA